MAKKTFEKERTYSNPFEDSVVQAYVKKIEPLLNQSTCNLSETKVAIEAIESAVQSLGNDDRNTIVKTHQIRNIFSLIKDAKNLKELTLIEPKISYIGARQDSLSGKFIVNIVKGLLNNIKKDNDNQSVKLEGLKYIMESVVAYHKFYHNKK